MLLEREREEIVRACRKLSEAGRVVGTAGNVSVLAGDLVAVTPSGVDYAELAARDIGVHRLDGTPVEAPLAPTSELPLHLAVYGAYAGAGTAAIVHTHSVAATAVARGTGADPLHVAMFGGTVRVAPYAATARTGRQQRRAGARAHRVPAGQPRRGHDRPGPEDRLRPRRVPGMGLRRVPARRRRRDPAAAAARRDRGRRGQTGQLRPAAVGRRIPYSRLVSTRFLGWPPAVLATLITVALVVGELTDAGQRRWWAARPLTTDTVAGLLVLLICESSS